MAEPIRKCARCRLRVQGVRPHGDGHSYCGRCLAQIESLEQNQRYEAEAPKRASDERPQAARAGGIRVTTKSALEQPAAEPTAEPAPSAAAPETAPQPASPPPAAAPLSDRERAITGAIAGSGGGSVLLEALTRERLEELQRRRRALVAELQVGERDMAGIDDRLGHIAALVDPAGKATTGRARRTDAA